MGTHKGPFRPEHYRAQQLYKGGKRNRQLRALERLRHSDPQSGEIVILMRKLGMLPAGSE